MPTLPDPDDLLPLAWRRRIYDVSTAAVPVLVVAGWVSEVRALLVLAVVQAALGFRAASHYASKTTTTPPGPAVAGEG